ncbi:hypothetical protein D3C87_1422210 [compost metagenome]
MRTEERLGGKPQAARRATARLVTYVIVQGGRAVVGKVPQGAVQLLDLHGRGAFLRAENRRGTVGAAQRVVDVGGDVEAHLGQARINLAQVDAGQLRKGEAAR